MRSLALVTAALVFFATEASAADEVTTLETQLGKEASELSTSDCAAACRALASIRRAADRICELEPGPRCDAARTKADDATKRVREACPECAIAGLKKDEEQERRAAKPADAPTQAATEAAPPAERPGGCRNCSTSSGAPDRGDFAVFALAALLLGRRSKKDRAKRGDGV
jgi:MYXO-CTERM domain-containing protein